MILFTHAVITNEHYTRGSNTLSGFTDDNLLICKLWYFVSCSSDPFVEWNPLYLFSDTKDLFILHNFLYVHTLSIRYDNPCILETSPFPNFKT